MRSPGALQDAEQVKNGGSGGWYPTMDEPTQPKPKRR
jgi:hypothetical protein